MKRALVAMWSVACTTGPAHRAAVTLAPQPIASASVAARPPPDRCASILASEREKVKAAIEKSKKEDASAWSERGVEADVMKSFVDPMTGMGIACHPFARGAWALEAQSVEVLPSFRSGRADLAVVLYLNEDRFARGDMMPAGAAGMFIRVDSLLASDYDNDGVPELWVRSEEDGVEGGHSSESYVFTLDHRTVKEYLPAGGRLEDLESPTDIDGDGLLDFSTSYAIRLGAGVECAGKSDWSAAKFLAHAQKDGTFSTSDRVAKEYVRSWCPSAPTTVANPEHALCAKLWKQPRTLVTSSCVIWDCALEMANKPQPKRAARDCEERIAAYDATVPFTLP